MGGKSKSGGGGSGQTHTSRQTANDMSTYASSHGGSVQSGSRPARAQAYDATSGAPGRDRPSNR